MSPHIGHNGSPGDPLGDPDPNRPLSTPKDVDESGLASADQALEIPVKAFPINVPPKLLDAFRRLGADPILSGGMAVQVWTGRDDGDFETHDLDFITHIAVRDLEKVGIKVERTGRHVVIDEVAVEFPSGPLGVGDLILDPLKDSLLVPTKSGEQVRCIRPEACVLDRLTLVAGSAFRAGFLQAAEVAIIQSQTAYWEDEWIDRNAIKAGLGNLWDLLKSELESGHPSSASLEKAVKLGWG